MYNDMVGNFGTFGGYMYDAFGGCQCCNNTMVIPHTHIIINNNNMDSASTTMANTVPNTITTNKPPDNHKSKWVISLSSTPLPNPRKPYWPEALTLQWFPSGPPWRSTWLWWRKFAADSPARRQMS